jgi:hypothetical protein
VLGALATPKPAADDLTGPSTVFVAWFGFWGCFVGVKDNPHEVAPNRHDCRSTSHTWKEAWQLRGSLRWLLPL